MAHSAFGCKGPDGIDDWSDITYDYTKGVVTKARRYNPASETANGKDFELEEIAYTHEERSGLWVPSTIESLIPAQLDLYQWRINDVTVNQGFDSSDFVVDFPTGVQITDHARKMFYVSGPGLPDEKVAVRQYMEKFGHQASDIAEGYYGQTTTRIIAITIAAALVAVLSILVLRRRFAVRTIGILIVACSFS